MSSIFGTNNDYFSGFFGNTSSNNSGINSLFGGGISMLGDYSMIKSGAYKKLLTAYYKTQDSSDKTSSSDESSSTVTKKDSVETARLLNTKTDASTLQSAADKLGDKSLYEATGKDENGKNVYDRDEIKKSVKSFVSAYNSYLDSTSSVDNTSVLNKSLSVVKKTASNQKLLKSVGITIGENNKLILDEDKLSEANISTLQSLFTGRYSYADEIEQKAAETYRLANSAAYTNNRGSSYTYSGSYSVLGTSNNSLDKYL